MGIASPRETVTRLIFCCGCDYKSLIASTNYFFDDELLKSLDSLRQRILDNGTAALEIVRAALSTLLIRERRRY